MEVAPRTRILGAVPKVEDTFWRLTPATRPSSARLMSGTPSSFTFSASTFEVAPVKRRRSVFCIPVTTTSPKVFSAMDITILTFEETLTVFFSIPMYVTTSRLALAGTFLITKRPLLSVVTPIPVPSTMTFAPMTGSPSVSTTVPVTCFWAKAVPADNAIPASRSVIFFDILYLFC